MKFRELSSESDVNLDQGFYTNNLSGMIDIEIENKSNNQIQTSSYLDLFIKHANFKLYMILYGMFTVFFPIIFFSMSNSNIISKQYTQTENLAKPLNDHINYRFIELDNELRVMLMQNSKTETAGCSVYLDIGSNHEPKTIPGLAHFFEHMVFYGSHTYKNTFTEYLTDNGGDFNAFTSDDEMAFHFHINGKNDYYNINENF